MEAIIDLLRTLQLNMLEVSIAGLFIFGIYRGLFVDLH